ncbi:BrnA antitoxin family protein [Mesorhizobium sp. Root552]|uniref:BrnA antitoxin family protein n=1 Tax=Mesorhizobium sp. Root552 TaxID=1736555 RepID=UPI000B105820|nr:BrnA antitoxin family protein [Mesorhizobium sp. Root552]
MREKRFSLMLEPTDLWAVWDSLEETPAVFGDRVLAGMNEAEALSACDVLNGIHEHRRWPRTSGYVPEAFRRPPPPPPPPVRRPPPERVRLEVALEPEVIAKFMAIGPGWQARMNDVLKEAKI